MPQYTITTKHASIIALDTHARTTTARGIVLETGQIKTRRFNDCPTPLEIADWIQKEFPSPQYCAYESGCTGFHLSRGLSEAGIACDVIAVSSIPKSSDDKQRKTDKRDAKGLLRELLVPATTLSPVWEPDPESEGMRDLLRSYKDVSAALMRSKQQMTALLLRHGYVWSEKTPTGQRKTAWGEAYWKWFDKIELDSDWAQETLLDYRIIVGENIERTKRLMRRIEQYAKEPRFKPFVDAFTCIRGVGVFSAMVFAAEFGDFFRFKNGRSVSKWAGLIPKSDESGEKKALGGHITKAGSAIVRYTLVEGLNSIGRRVPKMGKLKKGQVVSERVIAECNRCNHRIHERYMHLTKNMGKKANIAKVAVAREQIRWIWVIGCMVQEEQEISAKERKDI